MENLPKTTSLFLSKTLKANEINELLNELNAYKPGALGGYRIEEVEGAIIRIVEGPTENLCVKCFTAFKNRPV